MKKPSKFDLEHVPIPILGIGLFLGTAAVIAGMAGLSLLLPNTIFDWIWQMSPAVERGFRTDASKYGVLFLGLGIALGLAGWYWLERQEWARKLTIVIVGANIVSNLVRFMDTHSLEPAIIGLVGAALFVYLCSQSVRDHFTTN